MAALVMGHGGIARADPPPQQTICEIAHHSQAFNGKVVSVSGRVESDGQEYTLISDPACPAVGIGFKYTARASHSVAAQRLRKAIFFTGKPGTQDKVITVTLVGRFVGNREKWPKRLILVDEVSNIVVRPIK
ncbi:MAG TPA: hypothetical protein VFA39_02705 [Steroidobacteraceae bacterium]|nr:hypothetical protein [Steroidobacteraceae bacterium]